MGLSRRQFTKEFKLAAVRRLEQGVSIAEAARALEVGPNVLQRWRREFRQGTGNAFPGNGKQRWSEGRIAELERKGKGPAVRRVRLEQLDEGDCVQVLHVGPYSAEKRTIEAMHAFAAAQGRPLRGRHHEIYIPDPRRVLPERLKTILRQPVG